MKALKILLVAFSCITNLVLAQEKPKFGKVALTQIDTIFQKSNGQQILHSSLKPVSGTEFRLVKTVTDKIGIKHDTYQQYYNGIKVQYGVIKLHEKNGLKVAFNGGYFNPNGVRTSASISTQQVISTAKSYIGSNDVFWLGGDEISSQKTPTPELLILPNRKTETIHLAYAIGIGTNTPELKMGMVYIDANSGKVLKFKNQYLNCFTNKEEDHKGHNHAIVNKALLVSGTAATAYSGSQSFETLLDGADYILNDETRATGSNWNLSTQGLGTKTGIITVDMQTSTDVGGSIYEFTDGNNNWTAAEMSSNEDQYALDVHWGAQVVYDYWDNEHGRSGYNGTDGALLSLVHYGSNYTNAGWAAVSNTSGYMIYGDGDGAYTPLTSLDVTAHEIAHGIQNATSDLDYELEPGALNEGLSDIWAMVIENYSNNNHGTSKDFSEINEENGGGAFRSMSNPNSYNQPDTYGGSFWYDVVGCTPDGDSNSGGYNDYCGVHTNSGVLNYWFWLLSQGGSGTNDNGDAFNVTAIGMDDAASVVWQMQSNYLTSTSDFADARTHAIQAAVDLFGECSTQEQSVTDAFYAVGVGSAYVVVNPSVTTQPSNASTCEGDATSFYSAGSDADSLQWQVDDGNGWTDVTNDATYSGATNNTLNITNPVYSMDDYEYRLEYTNSCSTVTSNAVTLSIDEYAVASVVAQNETCAGADGSLIFTFDDNSSRTNLEFSIDGGSNYDYYYDDTAGSETVTGLSAATYNIWVRWGDNDCPYELGDYIISTGTTPTASVSNTTNETCTLNDGSIEVSFSDAATETQIDFSIDGGVTYAYSFDDTLGTSNFTGLTAGDYDIWASYGGNCAVSLGTITVSSDAPIATVAVIDASTGNSDGALVFTFDDHPTRNVVKFSIDGGVNYDYNFNDGLGSGSASGLAAATYNIWIIWGNDECPRELGDFTINESSLYTSIPDSNFENALNDLGYDDFNGDNKVPTALINIVQSLNVAYEGITDLTGIEAFVAMTSFDCRYNNLTSIDLTSNVLLDTFKCDNNSTLTSVNTSANTALLYYEAFNCDLSIIDISNNLSLLNLEVYNNNLTSLDLSSHASLEVLDCNNNSLTYLNFKNGNNSNTYNGEFDATGNTNLTCIEVDDVAYSTTTWTNVDGTAAFSNYCTYTAIPDSSFEAALDALGYDDISSDGQVPTELINTITTLDIDGESISDLTGIEDFTLLEELDADNNSLTSIDVSTLSSLRVLRLNYNNLSSIDVTSNTSLETLTFRNNSSITSIDLSNNTLLKTLHFQFNDVAAIDLTNNTALTGLICRDNDLTSLDLSQNTALTNVWAGDNFISSIDLSNNTLLTVVQLYNNNLTNLNLQNGNNTIISNFSLVNNDNLTCILVDDAAYSTTNWTNLDAHTSFSDTFCTQYTAIPDTNFEAALEALGYDDISSDGQVPTSLIENVTNLYISSLSISDLTGIEDFTALEELDANDNLLTSVDFSNNLALQLLEIYDNQIGAIDLSANTALTYLDLYNTGMTTIDVSVNTALTYLNLNTNSITTLDLSANTLLSELILSTNPISSIDLSVNTLLTSVDLQETNITSIDLTANTLLEDLDIGYNSFTSLDLSNNTALIDLDIDDNNFTNLDLSNNTLLERLFCMNNQITSLDLTLNTNLERVAAYDNNLSFVDVRNGNNTNIIYFSVENNPNLNCVIVDDTAYSNSNWGGSVAYSNTYCDYTAIPDANFESWLEDNGYDDISGDAQVPTALIEVATSIAVSFESITDFTGIEDFTALESLTVSYNSFTSLNVSNNLNLTFLNCGYSNLTSLDVSNNTLLETLWVNNTGITSLDLSLNTNLAALTASSMSSLTYLNVQNGNNTNVTQFTTVATSNLTCIIVDDVAYSDTNWTNIESGTSFSSTYCNYTAIPDSNFEAALEALGYDDISDDGQVPTALIEVVEILHVSSENISSLTGIEDFTALIDLNVSDNSFSSLDLSNNLLLEDLNCSFNNFFSIDLSQNVLLNSLYANDTWLFDIDVSANTQLQYLYLANNTFLNSLNYQNGNNTNNLLFNTTGCSNLNCIAVDDAAYSTTNWTSIEATTSFSDTYCEYTAIPDANFEAALEALGYDDISGDGQVPTALIEVITILDISNEGIADLTGIQDFDALTTLDCSNNQLSEVDFGNIPLMYLDISSNDLSILYAPDTIVNLLVNSNNLVYLDLTGYTDLEEVNASDNDLIYFNIQNGANTNIFSFIASNNADLTCILVDDDAYSTTNWTNIDATTSFSTTYCKYTQIPDANFEARLESLGLDDITGDGQVPTGLIIDYESIDLSFNNSGAIYDLTGIQDFYSLYNLILTDNLMTSVDLSANVKLGLLTANNTALTSIDLSTNPDMNYINVSDCDDLSSVNIQNGNNTKLISDSSFSATNVPNLFCVLVDDEAFANTTWVDYKDPQISYSDTFCGGYTAIPDANFEARLETLGYDDISGDGQVPTALIEVVTDLDVSSKNISDLTGIEDFIALVTLDCETNSITSLDLSNNTLLETIDCDGNDLTSLDFGNNTVLKTLICNNSTSLGTLDLSNNTGLEYIQLSNNGLTSIDINGLTALITLGVDNNNLTAIDVTTNTALEIFTASNNSILNFDVTSNTSLTYLTVSDNLLTSIDVSDNTSLEYFYCSDNIGITTLDVSVNTALKTLYAHDNSLTGLDLSTNSALTSLLCFNNTLTSLNLQNGNNTNLTFAVFTDNPNLTCILVDDAAYSTTNWTNVDSQTTFSETDCNAKLDTKVFLQGAGLNPNAGEETLMRDDLRLADYIPTTSPYTDALTCASTVFNDGGTSGTGTADDNIVDWVEVELRDLNDNTTIIETRSALLQRDGDIVDVDGLSSVTMSSWATNYYVTINHRNHLSIMTVSTITLDNTVKSVDFTDVNNQITYGSNAQTDFGMPTDMVAMWAGDASRNGQVRFLGPGNDLNSLKSYVLSDLGNTSGSSSYPVTGYSDADINLNGQARFLGPGNDNNILKSIILANPENSSSSTSFPISQQIPQ